MWAHQHAVHMYSGYAQYAVGMHSTSAQHAVGMHSTSASMAWCRVSHLGTVWCLCRVVCYQAICDPLRASIDDFSTAGIGRFAQCQICAEVYWWARGGWHWSSVAQHLHVPPKHDMPLHQASSSVRRANLSSQSTGWLLSAKLSESIHRAPCTWFRNALGALPLFIKMK